MFFPFPEAAVVAAEEHEGIRGTRHVIIVTLFRPPLLLGATGGCARKR
jgi:hypothetical protein